MMKFKRISSSVLASTLLGSGLLVLGVPQAAHAAEPGGTCYSTDQEREDTGYNSKRVRAYCNYLRADSKAKGVLIRGLGNSDAQTAWFTVLHTYRYSEYKTCSPLAPCKGTRVEITNV